MNYEIIKSFLGYNDESLKAVKVVAKVKKKDHFQGKHLYFNILADSSL